LELVASPRSSGVQGRLADRCGFELRRGDHLRLRRWNGIRNGRLDRPVPPVARL
jgi:hypothetical protein